MICVICPKGCNLTVKTKNKEVISVEGNACKRGIDYAISETTDPRRMLCTTVRVDGGGMLPVKSDKPLPKGNWRNYICIIGNAQATCPIDIGDVIVPDIDGTGINIVATTSLQRSEKA